MRDNLIEKYPPTEHFNGDQVEEFCKSYFEAMFWASYDYSETDETGNPKHTMGENYGIENFAQETFDKHVEVCREFLEANLADFLIAKTLNYTLDQGGHDLWLTRCGHGAGFWDRGLGTVGDRLTKASKVYGDCHVYVGDDGMVYTE